MLRKLRETSTRPSEIPVWPLQMAGLIRLVTSHQINSTVAKDVFNEMWASGKDAATIVDEKGLRQESDEAALGTVIDAVLAAETKAVADYRSGKTRARPMKA